MALTSLKNHLAELRGLYLEQFKNRPNFDKVFTILAKHLDELETLYLCLEVMVRLDNATGALLDQWGDLLNVPRQQADDNAYRDALKFKVFVINSEGTSEEVMSFVRALTQATDVEVFDVYPAKVSVYTNGTSFPDGIVGAVDEMLAAGVGIDEFVYISPGLTPFTFSENQDQGGHFAEVSLGGVLTATGAGQFTEAIT